MGSFPTRGTAMVIKGINGVSSKPSNLLGTFATPDFCLPTVLVRTNKIIPSNRFKIVESKLFTNISNCDFFSRSSSTKISCITFYKPL